MIPRKLQHLILILASISILVLFSGCTSMSLSKPTPTVTLFPTIRPPKPTRTPTSVPTATALPTGTPTITPTPTLLPPRDDFSQAKLYAFGPTPGWDFSFTLLLPEEIKGEYNATIGDPPKPFTCRPLTEYGHPDRLYCTGRIPKVDQNLDFKIMQKSTGQVVFKGQVFSPLP
jgi:hypothetical protein